MAFKKKSLCHIEVSILDDSSVDTSMWKLPKETSKKIVRTTQLRKGDAVMTKIPISPQELIVILVALQSIGVFLYLSSIASNTTKSNDLLEDVKRYIGWEARKLAYVKSRNSEAINDNGSEINKTAKAISNIKGEIKQESIVAAMGATSLKVAEARLISIIGCKDVDICYSTIDVEIDENVIEIKYGKCPKKLSKKLIAVSNFAKEMSKC